MVDIPGATGSTYTLVGADLGQNISVKVTATNVAGSANAVSANAGPVTTPPPKSIDGTAGSQFSGTNTGTITLTTTLANDVIVLMYFHESNNNPAATISTVTSPHLTWTRHNPAYQFSVNPSNMEIWWAPAVAALTAEVITITLTGPIDDSAYVAFGVNGCSAPSSPWDTSASLVTARTTGGNPSVTVSGVSTDSSVPMLIGFTGTSTGNAVTKPASTNTLVAEQNNAGGVQFARLVSFYQNPGSALSSASYTTTSAASIWGMILDALA